MTAAQAVPGASRPPDQDSGDTVEDLVASLVYNDAGLVCAVVQQFDSKQVLMVAWMDRDALKLTWQNNEAVYWSRSRKKLWHKGEESGHIQKVKEIRLDCDGDVILLQVEQQGGIACHTGRESCFYSRLEQGKWVEVDAVLKSPDEIYPRRDI